MKSNAAREFFNINLKTESNLNISDALQNFEIDSNQYAIHEKYLIITRLVPRMIHKSI